MLLFPREVGDRGHVINADRPPPTAASFECTVAACTASRHTTWFSTHLHTSSSAQPVSMHVYDFIPWSRPYTMEVFVPGLGRWCAPVWSSICNMCTQINTQAAAIQRNISLYEWNDMTGNRTATFILDAPFLHEMRHKKTTLFRLPLQRSTRDPFWNWTVKSTDFIPVQWLGWSS